MVDQVFHELYVGNNPLGNSVVYWGLNRVFCDPPPYRFEVQWAEAPDGQWETVPTGPIVDTYFAVDPNQRVWAMELETFYRVILTTSKGQYTSFAHEASGIWTKQDWLYARDICRREFLTLRKFTGTKGWLLKRKIWGPPCPVCLDWDTNEVGRNSCPRCYGAGKDGGYWPGHEFYYSENEYKPRHKTQDDNVGMRDDIILNGRVIAYPHVSTYDVFIEEDSGLRYVIRSIQHVAKIKGIPLIEIVELRQAPFTDVVYQIPIWPPPYQEPAPEPLIRVSSDDHFLDMPEPPPEPEPDVPPTPTPPPAPEPPEPELHVPLAPFFAIWWEDGQWRLGSTVGDEQGSLYSTTDGVANPAFVPGYNWVPVGAPAGSTLSLTNIQDGFTVASSVSGVSGNYLRAGTYGNMYAYLQQ